MLTGIATRRSTPHEDAEPRPGGSARPVLDYRAGTLGMTRAGARQLLKAARTAQAETGPGALAGYPVPGRDALLPTRYAPGSRACRFKLTARNRIPGASPAQEGRRAAAKRRTAPRPAAGGAPPGCPPRRARQRRGRRRSRGQATRGRRRLRRGAPRGRP
jgi:hypothetical protein